MRKLWITGVCLALIACSQRSSTQLPPIANGMQFSVEPHAAWRVSKVGHSFSSPVDVAVGPNNAVYVADAGHDVVKKVTPDGNIRVVVKSEWLTYPYSVSSLSVDQIGDIFFVVDGFDERFNSHGNPRNFGDPYDRAGSLAVDYNSLRVYLYNFESHEVQRFNFPYTYGQFTVIYRSSHVGTMSVGKGGNLYLTDGCEVQRISPNGKERAHVARGLKCPHEIAADNTGAVFAIQDSGKEVKEDLPSGKVATIGTNFSANAIAVDSSDNVYLSEPNQNAVVKLTHP